MTVCTTPENPRAPGVLAPGESPRRWNLRSFERVVVVALSVAGLVACAPEAPDTALPDGVSVELRQSRADVAARQAAVTVHNGSDDPLEVGDVAVADPRFARPAERVVERISSLAPGATVDVRVQLAPVVCEVGDDADATLTLAYEHGGRSGVAVVPIVDAVPFVSQLHARECVQHDALRSASIDLVGFVPAPAGESGALELAVVPAPGAGDLRITGIRETNLLTFDGVDDGVFPLDIDQTRADRAAITVVLPVRPLRCDAHAVQEDKRGTVFRLFVDLAGEAGSFDLAASPQLRGRILGWIADWCGFGAE